MYLCTDDFTAGPLGTYHMWFGQCPGRTTTYVCKVHEHKRGCTANHCKAITPMYYVHILIPYELKFLRGLIFAIFADWKPSAKVLHLKKFRSGFCAMAKHGRLQI